MCEIQKKRGQNKIMDDGYSPFSILVFAGLILLEAAFYGFGAAIQSINVSSLEREEEDGNKKAAVLLKLIHDPGRFVNAVQIVSSLIGMVVGIYIFRQWNGQMEHLLQNVEVLPTAWLHVLSMILSSIVLLVLWISFGIVIPKRCAFRKPEKWAYQMIGMITVVTTLLFPFIQAVNGISYVVLKLAGMELRPEEENVTEEDIMLMVNEGHEQGVLEASEAEMITNIFEFSDKEAGDIMTHRKNLVALDSSMALKDAVAFVLREGKNSRYPVYREDIDDIIGILHMKDALICADRQKQLDIPIGEIPGLLREIYFIPETRKIRSLFEEMQSQKIHMEVVVDEYGQTAGLVTMEDILEEIVGNIQDEFDVEEEYVVQAGDDNYIMDGMTMLDEVSEALDIEFSEEDLDMYDTLNGFLISRLGHIPQEDERSEVEYSGYRFRVARMEGKIIRSVQVTPVEPLEDETKEQSRME